MLYLETALGGNRELGSWKGKSTAKPVGQLTGVNNYTESRIGLASWL